jgi:hypothetical protein
MIDREKHYGDVYVAVDDTGGGWILSAPEQFWIDKEETSRAADDQYLDLPASPPGLYLARVWVEDLTTSYREIIAGDWTMICRLPSDVGSK